MMSLALRMGRTIHEIERVLSSSELKMWIEFDRISPIGDWRGDVQSAQISSAILNSQGAKADLKEMLLSWGECDQSEEVSGLESWMCSL